MRLDKRRSGLALGSPASCRFAAGNCRNFQLVVSRVLYSLYYFFIYLCRGSIDQYLLNNKSKSILFEILAEIQEILKATKKLMNSYRDRV